MRFPSCSAPDPSQGASNAPQLLGLGVWDTTPGPYFLHSCFLRPLQLHKYPPRFLDQS